MPCDTEYGDAYAQGGRDFDHGFTVNPYQRDTREHAAWSCGWFDALWVSE